MKSPQLCRFRRLSLSLPQSLTYCVSLVKNDCSLGVQSDNGCFCYTEQAILIRLLKTFSTIHSQIFSFSWRKQYGNYPVEFQISCEPSPGDSKQEKRLRFQLFRFSICSHRAQSRRKENSSHFKRLPLFCRSIIKFSFLSNCCLRFPKCLFI